jgi:mono/diheme cytochrome c family protein
MKVWIPGILMICGWSLMVTLVATEKPVPPGGPGSEMREPVQGAALYKAHCAVCHGQDAKGGGPMAKSLKVNPPDLTRIAAQNRGHFPLARIQKIIASEVPIPAGHGTREMPVWGPVFSQIVWDQDLGQIRVYNLARYIEEKQAK